MMLIHTPHFTIRVWGSPGPDDDRWRDWVREARKRVPIAEIEVDSTVPGTMTINRHRGLEIINQKMLPPVPEQPTLWHQEERL